MCGIAGIVGTESLHTMDLAVMARALAHRGPDGTGFLLHARDRGTELLHDRAEPGLASLPHGWDVGIAHKRLAIIDLDARSDQPMRDAATGVSVAFNGEIYNYLELRRQLEHVGHRFLTTGDTEVLLRSYIEWGESCVERFRGMWAFALLDERRRRVVLSRDRFGIKPLYCAAHAGGILFASEIKALLAVSGFRSLPDRGALTRYLLSGVLDTDQSTFFEGIRRFPAAHFAILDLDDRRAERLAPQRYWSLPRSRFAGSEREAMAAFRESFASSIEMHMRSDVPVGTCLSGGLDSSAIVCEAAGLRRRLGAQSEPYICVGYCAPDPAVAERHYMEAVANRADVELIPVEVDESSFLNAVPKLISNADEPVGSAGCIMRWFVFREARRAGLKVMLDGQGADELLGGYHHYYPALATELLMAGQLLRYRRFRADHRRAHGELRLSTREMLDTNLIAPFMAILGRSPTMGVESLGPAGGLLSDSTRRFAVQARVIATPYRSLDDALRSQLERDSLPALLRYEDNDSMAHSVEARVPFLDHHLVELALSLPSEMKIRGLTTKHILREAMRGIVPDCIVDRTDKIGFRAEPGFTWALAQRHSKSLVEPQTGEEEALFDRDGVASILQTPPYDQEAEYLLWRLVNAKLWLRRFWG